MFVKIMKAKTEFIDKKVGELAGFPVLIVDIYPHDLMVECKGVKGFYSQMRDFLQDDVSHLNTHIFGFEEKICKIKQGETDPNIINVGCLAGTYAEMTGLVREGENILNEYNNLVCGDEKMINEALVEA